MVPSDSALSFPLSICVFAETSLVHSLQPLLDCDRYQCQWLTAPAEFLQYVEQHHHEIDCLILQNTRSSLSLLDQLYVQGALLPIAIVESPASLNAQRQANPIETAAATRSHYHYHTGEVWLLSTQLEQIVGAIEQAIARFLKLSPPASAESAAKLADSPLAAERLQPSLRSQQRRLADKLQERLGYLGVYYKRNPQDFFRHLDAAEKKAFLKQLQAEYREIILNYFADDYPLNQAIDQLVNHAFFADLSVSQVLEVHMELMDEFGQQLKLEGRSDEILLDYRLALIDIIAHLCEMYRRSIPREDIPHEVFAIRDE